MQWIYTCVEWRGVEEARRGEVGDKLLMLGFQHKWTKILEDIDVSISAQIWAVEVQMLPHICEYLHLLQSHIWICCHLGHIKCFPEKSNICSTSKVFHKSFPDSLSNFKLDFCLRRWSSPNPIWFIPLWLICRAIPSYQRRSSFPRKREGNVRFPTNLYGVRCSARPTSRWTPKAHRMMGKTQ